MMAPCHRVVGASGALTGFAGGLAAKRNRWNWKAGSERLWRVDPVGTTARAVPSCRAHHAAGGLVSVAPSSGQRRLPLPQQVPGGPVIGGRIAESVCNDDCARDGRQSSAALFAERPSAGQLVEAHLEETRDFREEPRAANPEGRAKDRTRAHVLVGRPPCRGSTSSRPGQGRSRSASSSIEYSSTIAQPSGG